MTTKLRLYNGALAHCSTVRLANLTEDRKERYELDAVYDDTLAECLELGLWKFAKRTVQMFADPDIEPSFGKPYAFPFPEDYVRTIAFCTDEELKVEVEDWQEENEVWYADIDTIYLSFVSNDLTYGGDLGKFTPSYTAFVETRLALKAALPITRDKVTRNDLLQLDQQALRTAKRLDAVDEPIKYSPPGRLVGSRSGFGISPDFANGRMRFRR